MAINKNIILNHLDSAFDSFARDSSDALELLQLIDAVKSISPWQDRGSIKLYDSIGGLPLDSNLEGMTAVIQSFGSNNGLYLNTGATWELLLDFDSDRPVFPGTTFGFTSGGNDGANRITNIDKFSFSTEGTATDHGDLNTARNNIAGNSSKSDGYVAGGNPGLTSIEKFSFSGTAVSSTLVGDISKNIYSQGAASTEYHGYLSSLGDGPISTFGHLEKFRFSSDVTGIHSADLAVNASYYARTGHSSSSHGYFSGGYYVGYRTNIERFPFSNDNNSVLVGNISPARAYAAGQSSLTHGYTSGGITLSPISPRRNEIDKWSFANDTTSSSNVGTLDTARSSSAGVSSTTNGYTMGGSEPIVSRLVDKFPYANPFVSAIDVGDLFIAKSTHAGHQV